MTMETITDIVLYHRHLVDLRAEKDAPVVADPPRVVPVVKYCSPDQEGDTMCGGDCKQGRAVCTCPLRMPKASEVPLDYSREPFPAVARWCDEHPVGAPVALLVFLLVVFVLGAWLDGPP